MNDKSLIVGALALIIVIGGILYLVSGNQSDIVTDGTPVATSSAVASGPNLPLAQCLKDKGVVFYGAFWCPHCKTQKEDFGDAASALPYVECSNLDKSQTPICAAKKIMSYPTWRFPDGTELTGDQKLVDLAKKANCTDALPPALGGVVSTTSPALAPLTPLTAPN